MRTIVLVIALVALAAPSHAAPKSTAKADDHTVAKKCHEMAGKEVGEGEGRSGMNRNIVQRWSDCMIGMSN